MSEETKVQDNTTTVEFYGKPVKGELIVPGVVRRATRKSAKSYLVQCSITGRWCYCSVDRHDKLVGGKYATEEDLGKNYISRDGLKQATVDVPVEG